MRECRCPHFYFLGETMGFFNIIKEKLTGNHEEKSYPEMPAPPSNVNLNTIPVSDEYVRAQISYTQVQSINDILRLIDEGHFSRRGSRLMKSFTTSCFDNNILFSRNDKSIDEEIKYLQFEIDASTMKFMLPRRDIDNKHYLPWEKMVRQQYIARISRTRGDTRWGLLAMNPTTNIGIKQMKQGRE